LEELFLSKGFCTLEDIAKVKTVQKEYEGRIGTILLNWGIITQEQLLEIYSAYFDIPYMESSEGYEIKKLDSLDIPNSFWVQNKVFPLEKSNKDLKIILNDPFKIDIFSFIELQTSLEAKPILVTTQVLDEYQLLYEQKDDGDEVDLFDDDDRSNLKELAGEAPIIQKVNPIFQ